MCVSDGRVCVCDSLVDRYQTQATALFGGSGVVSATADVVGGSGVFVAAGSGLFKVSLLGDITAVGRLQDTGGPDTEDSLVPTGLVFHSRNRQCPPTTSCLLYPSVARPPVTRV